MTQGPLHVLTLAASAGVIASAADTELNLQKYYVNPGKRPMSMVVCAIFAASDSGTATFDYKMQESATTVDSDFSDISGAAVTQYVADESNVYQLIPVFTAKQYVRGYHTVGAGNWDFTAGLIVGKRDA